MIQPEVCVIIVSYNFEKWMDICLSSVLKSTIPCKIVVVDNLSKDDTCKLIEENYSEITLIRNHENAGFGKANNIGIKYAINNNYSYAFLLNQDAWVEPDAIEKLVKVAKTNPKMGIISPVHLNGKGDAPDTGFVVYTGLKSLEEISLIKDKIKPVKFVNAAMWLVPVNVLIETGGFDPLFRHYGEDVNLAQRIRKKGYEIGIVPDAIGYHGRETREINREQFFYSEYVYFLTEAANPFYNSAQAFAYSVAAGIRKAFRELAKGKMEDAKEYFIISKQLYQEWSNANRSRKKYHH